MRLIVAFAAVALLLAGCVLTQDEIDQAHGYMGEMTLQLKDADTQLHQHNWVAAHSSIAAANSTLSKLDGLLATAEQRGADAEKIRRLRAASTLMHGIFNYTYDLTDYYIAVTDMRDRLNNMTIDDWERTNVTEMRAEMNALRARANVVETEGYATLTLVSDYKRDFPQDAEFAHVDNMTANLQRSISSLEELESRIDDGMRQLPAG